MDGTIKTEFITAHAGTGGLFMKWGHVYEGSAA